MLAESVYSKWGDYHAPYPNADTAIAGEDAMKAFLVEANAKVLGGEFFLAEQNLIDKTWAVGAKQANAAMRKSIT